MTADVLILDARWRLSDKGEVFLSGSLAQTDAAFEMLQILPFSDVPIELIDPDDDPGQLPGPGEDTGAALRFHDYEGFAEVHEYSDLEYDELRATLGANYRVRPYVRLFASVTYLDLSDDAPYLQDATGSATIAAGGAVWRF